MGDGEPTCAADVTEVESSTHARQQGRRAASFSQKAGIALGTPCLCRQLCFGSPVCPVLVACSDAGCPSGIPCCLELCRLEMMVERSLSRLWDKDAKMTIKQLQCRDSLSVRCSPWKRSIQTSAPSKALAAALAAGSEVRARRQRLT